MPERITDVFVTTGLPTITYVERDQGHFERYLNRALNEGGQLCLLTGPSKTGKTTLYKNVLNQRKAKPLQVRCSASKTVDDIWRDALDGIDFSEVTEQQNAKTTSTESSVSTGVDAGIGWFGKLAARFGIKVDNKDSIVEIRRKIKAEISATKLAIALKETNYVFVLEDFHYLSDEVKIELFQQWKAFVDEEVSVIVVETSHRAIDIARSNGDLVGRVTHLDIESWSKDDIKKIITKGFDYITKEISETLKEKISEESVGLPIIAQQVCLQIFSDRMLDQTAIPIIKKTSININFNEINDAFYNVACTRYSHFEAQYKVLVRGAREKARKYKTYEIILSCFSSGNIQFSLTRAELDRRINLLSLDESERPPAASINSTLGALQNFQKERNIELLEWRSSEDVLHILEPIFLFYLRWRVRHGTDLDQLSFFDILLREIEGSAKKSVL